MDTFLKRFLRASVTTVTGGIVIMLVLATGIFLSGTYLSGGFEQWQENLEWAAPGLFVWRLILYIGVAWFWHKTYQAHKALGNVDHLHSLRKIGQAGLVLALLVEASLLHKLLG